MALAFVQRKQGGVGSSSTSSQSVTFNSTTAAGSLIVVLLAAYAGGSNVAFSGVTDTAGNTYTAAGTSFSDNNRHEIWYATNATANAGTVTATTASNVLYLSIVAYEITGADTAAPFDTSATGTGTGTSIASGTLTLATSSEIIVACITAQPTITAGTGYTGVNYALPGDAGAYYMDEYHIVSASEAASASQSTGSSWGILAAAFKAAGGGGAARPVKMVGRWGGYAGSSGGFAA